MKSFVQNTPRHTLGADKGSIKEVETLLLVGDENSPLRQKFMDYLARLEPSFHRFKRTKAFKKLEERIMVLEKIAERIY